MSQKKIKNTEFIFIIAAFIAIMALFYFIGQYNKKPFDNASKMPIQYAYSVRVELNEVHAVTLLDEANLDVIMSKSIQYPVVILNCRQTMIILESESSLRLFLMHIYSLMIPMELELAQRKSGEGHFSTLDIRPQSSFFVSESLKIHKRTFYKC